MHARIFLVEDHPVMREGYSCLIANEPGLEVCGEAATAEEALPAVLGLRPDLVVVDLVLPGAGGLELTERLRALDACEAVLVVSARDEAVFAERALAARAHGYLPKNEVAGAFVGAIHRVLSGRPYLPESFRDQLLLNDLGRRIRASDSGQVAADAEPAPNGTGKPAEGPPEEGVRAETWGGEA